MTWAFLTCIAQLAQNYVTGHLLTTYPTNLRKGRLEIAGVDLVAQTRNVQVVAWVLAGFGAPTASISI